LDVSFGEDGCRARKDNSPKNLAALRKIALGLLRAADTGVSVRRKMRLACISPDFLGKIIFNRQVLLPPTQSPPRLAARRRRRYNFGNG